MDAGEGSVIDPRSPAALAADALFAPAMRAARELALTAGVEGLRLFAEHRCAHVEVRRAGEWSGVRASTLAEAVETLARGIGRADLAEWIALQREHLRRADTIPAPADHEAAS